MDTKTNNSFNCKAFKIKVKQAYNKNFSVVFQDKKKSCEQILTTLHKTVIHCSYDYFPFMKKDYDYKFVFASRSTITSSI